MTYADFDTVLELPAKEQRRLLAEGDAPERLWAAWAVALRLGRDAVPSLTMSGALRAPSGLRRQLLVVIAGLGERDVLRVLTDQDDAPEVRATACAYFIRTAPRADNGEIVTFAAQHLRSESKEVREAVLLEQEAGRLRLPEPLLSRALHDPDPDNRALVCRCLCADSQMSDATVHVLIEALEREPDHHLLRAMFEMLPRSGYRTLVERLCSSSTSRLGEILDLAHERAEVLQWSEVMALAPCEDFAIVCRLLRLLRGPLPDDALIWAARICVRSSESAGAGRNPHRDEAAWHAGLLLRGSLSRHIVDILDRATVGRLAQFFEEEHAQLVAYWSEDDSGDEDGVDEAAADLRRCIGLLHERCMGDAGGV